MMGIDKNAAIKGNYRIPERTLMALAAFGGSLGAITGMLVFRHKTKHKIRHWGSSAYGFQRGNSLCGVRACVNCFYAIAVIKHNIKVLHIYNKPGSSVRDVRLIIFSYTDTPIYTMSHTNSAVLIKPSVFMCAACVLSNPSSWSFAHYNHDYGYGQAWYKHKP